MGTLATLLLLGWSLLGDTYLEVPLPPGAQPLAEQGRYASSRNFDETLDFYKYHFKYHGGGVRWRNVVNLPHIRAKHVQSLKPTPWQGINIYEYNGRVRIFVVPRSPEPGS